MDSPSISGFVAKMTSVMFPVSAFSFSPAIVNSSGPMPSKGEMTPINTWYTPLNSPMASMT